MQLSEMTESLYDNRSYYLTKLLEALGIYQSSIYNDKPATPAVGNPTIGIGFNVREGFILDGVLEQFGFDLTDPAQLTIRNNLHSIFQGTGPWQAAADAQISSWAALVGGGARTTFQIASQIEAKVIFEDFVDNVFDPAVATFLTQAGATPSEWENTYERMALTDLAYNNILSDSISLRSAISIGDRAEAWYEISYNSNGDELSGILKRRIIEGEVFGLYDDEVSENWTAPSEDEALKVFRMLNKHQVQISGELTNYVTALADAQTDWTALNSEVLNDTGSVFKDTSIESLDPMNWLDGQFKAAADVLTDKYLGFMESFEEAIVLYANWGYDFENILDFEADNIFVAAETQGVNQRGHGAEVVARHVERGAGVDQNDLIFSGIADDSDQYSYVLNSGGGDDVIVLGAGADTVDGGDGFDGVSLQMATTDQTLNFETGQHSGSVVNGDTFSNVEYFIGSDQGDTVTGGEDDLIFFGGNGIDTITGGSGDDILFAGGGATNTLAGGDGDDEIWGGSGQDALDGGDGYDSINYMLSTAGITLNFVDGVGAGSGGYAQSDTVEGFENIVGSEFVDTITNWGAGENYDGETAFRFYGRGGNDNVSWVGEGIVGFEGGSGQDIFSVTSQTDRVPFSVWFDFVGGDDVDKLYLEGNTLGDFSGGAGADEVHATSPQSTEEYGARWYALGSGLPVWDWYAGYEVFEDYSDKTEDRFFLDNFALTFSFSESDFVDGDLGEYLYGYDLGNGAISISYRGTIDSFGVFQPDDLGDQEIYFYLSQEYDDPYATGIQDLSVSVADVSGSEEQLLAGFRIFGFEQGDYGISFDLPTQQQQRVQDPLFASEAGRQEVADEAVAFDTPSGMGESFTNMTSSEVAEGSRLQFLQSSVIPTESDLRTANFETPPNYRLQEASWDFDFDAVKVSSHSRADEGFLRAYDEPEEFEFNNGDAGWPESSNLYQLPDDFSHEFHRLDFHHHELMA